MAKEIINKGTVIIKTKEDKDKALRYIQALLDGDELYKPSGLEIK
jgi:hypothetical protein